jgi:hypothetical protein
MAISGAHLRAQGIGFLVARADARAGLESDRKALLFGTVAPCSGLQGDKAALAFTDAGRLTYAE